MKLLSIDISAKTGRGVTTGLTSWLTTENQETAEHLAGVDSEGNLLIYTWKPSTDWTVKDISAQIGRKFAKMRPTAWLTNGRNTVEHIALADEDGNLIVCWHTANSTNPNWGSFNISDHTDQKVSTKSRPVAWQNKENRRTTEYLFCTDDDGQVFEFRFHPTTDWKVKSVSQFIRFPNNLRMFKDSLTGWEKDIDGDTAFHLAGTIKDGTGRLIELIRDDRGFWIAKFITDEDDNRFRKGATVSWLVGNIEHIAAVSQFQLILYWRSHHRRPWRRVNISEETNTGVFSISSAYVIERSESGTNQTTECITAIGGFNNIALRFWWTPTQHWQVLNVTQSSGNESNEPVEAWLSKNGNETIEHVVTVDRRNKVSVCKGLKDSRIYTEQLSKEVSHRFVPFSRDKISKDTLLLAWKYKDLDPRHDLPAIENAAFGSRGIESAEDYFRFVSNGLFRLNHVDTQGWFTSDFVRDWYFGRLPPDNEYNKWRIAHHRKYLESIHKADNVLDYSIFDDNRDKVLSPDELGIVIAVGDTGGGFIRRATEQERPHKSLIRDDVKFGDIAEWYAGDPVLDTPTLAHELCHLYLKLTDLYAFDTPYKATGFDIMDLRQSGNKWCFSHPCGVWKLMLGWVKPIVAAKSNRYHLEQISTSQQVIVLPRPGRETNEYFLLENRQQSPYDDLPDTGLAIWHYVGADVHSKIAPFGVEQSVWGKYDGEFRQKIRLIKPVLEVNNLSKALWDGSDPETGYDLTSQRQSNKKAALVWADGTHSGYAIRNLSASKHTMSFDIEVPED